LNEPKPDGPTKGEVVPLEELKDDYYRALELPIADWTRSYNNRFWKKGIVDRPLRRIGSIQID
jgi:hypothetical protein